MRNIETKPIFQNLKVGDVYTNASGIVLMKIGIPMYSHTSPENLEEYSYIPRAEDMEDGANAVVLLTNGHLDVAIGEAVWEEWDSYVEKYTFDFLGGTDMEDE